MSEATPSIVIKDDINAMDESQSNNHSESNVEKSNGRSQFDFPDNDNIENIDNRIYPSHHSSSDDGSREGINPQEASTLDRQSAASSPQSDFDVKVYNDSLKNSPTGNRVDPDAPSVVLEELLDSNTTKRKQENVLSSSRIIRKRKAFRHRKGLVLREAKIDESTRPTSTGVSIPSNQYDTVLVRRAIRKKDALIEDKAITNKIPNKNAITQTSSKTMEVYGDISLGMKLSVVEGKVIVQHLNPLDDGRASPAQLTGVISRGDVLISVNQRSLVNLPLDQLMDSLRPLSTPDANGVYQRRIKLRFARQLGLDLLKSMEHNNVSKPYENENLDAAFDVARDMMALFPMVDQLSGMPYFEQETTTHSDSTKNNSTTDNLNNNVSQNEENQSHIPIKPLSRNELIAQNLASIRSKDRDVILHEFGSWNKNFADSLEVDVSVDEISEQDVEPIQSLSQLIEIGRSAVAGAGALSKQAEEVDSGKDIRSFRSWNTSLSVYSRASNRRKRILESGSLPPNFGRLEENLREDCTDAGMDSLPSIITEDEEKIDGDELLLHLAAHDEIWRKQVIDDLEKVSAQISNDALDNENEDEKVQQVDDIDSAVSNFLFGSNMTKILKKQGKPRSLPSAEITTVLFDLATKIASSIPDEITATGDPMSIRSSLVPFSGMKRPTQGSDMYMATRFLLDEALPVWLKSFRPLPWDYRRILWPLELRIYQSGSTATSSMSDDLTIESMGTGRQTVIPKRQDDIVSVIEDREMNTETRGETCFLATFFFTQAMLPKLIKVEKEDSTAYNEAIDAMIVFLGEYGSYLRLYTCLAYAAVLKSETVIDLLLGIAKNDPRHREVMKQTSKWNQLIFYEPTMLSAVIQRLYNINAERTIDRKKKLIELCSAAYPDVRPWQVKRHCVTLPQSKQTDDAVEMANLYYVYLTFLLHPTEGNEIARREPSLVAEWCEISVRKAMSSDSDEGFLDNFLCVASRLSSFYSSYFRDLAILLNLAMDLKDYNLALDLVFEILDDKKLTKQNENLDLIVLRIREMGFDVLDTSSTVEDYDVLFRRILLVFTKQSIRTGTRISSELVNFLDRRKRSTEDSKEARIRVLELVSFFAKESIPVDLLEALVIFPLTDLTPDVFSVLQTVLARGALECTPDELSTARLRLRHARKLLMSDTMADPVVPSALPEENEQEVDNLENQSIWRSMAQGLIVVDK